jgi:hypothetical protein
MQVEAEKPVLKVVCFPLKTKYYRFWEVYFSMELNVCPTGNKGNCCDCVGASTTLEA